MLRKAVVNSVRVVVAGLVLLGCWKVLGEKRWTPESGKAPPATETWMVTKVSDGDTIEARQAGGQEVRIRLCGIDAPETAKRGEPGQPLGQESRTNLQRLVDEAKGEVQVSVLGTDRYGRKIGEIFTVLGEGREKSLNEEQLTSGMAYLYRQYVGNCPNKDVFEQAEAIAKQKRLGVWGGNYQKPWDYRKERR